MAQNLITMRRCCDCAYEGRNEVCSVCSCASRWVPKIVGYKEFHQCITCGCQDISNCNDCEHGDRYSSKMENALKRHKGCVTCRWVEDDRSCQDCTNGDGWEPKPTSAMYCFHCDLKQGSDQCMTCNAGSNMFSAMYDSIQKPSHYASGAIECIDVIKECLTPEEFHGFCLGNTIKYVFRHHKKNGVEDLKKAQWYLNRRLNNE